MSSFIKPKIVNTRVRLRSSNFANFAEYYHKNDSTNDYLFKVLKNMCDSHKLLTNDLELFKAPMTNEGFYFKLPAVYKCTSLSKRPCIINDLYDCDVMMKLRIQPYNFAVEGKQLIGVSVYAVEMYAVKEL